MNAVKMCSLRSICGLILRDTLRNEVIQECCGLKEYLCSTVTKNINIGMRRWFAHVKRTPKYLAWI